MPQCTREFRSTQIFRKLMLFVVDALHVAMVVPTIYRLSKLMQLKKKLQMLPKCSLAYTIPCVDVENTEVEIIM